jgi:hypothetical protein
VIGDQTYEDRPVETLDLFLPLVESISEGRVIQRRMISSSSFGNQFSTIVSA